MTGELILPKAGKYCTVIWGICQLPFNDICYTYIEWWATQSKKKKHLSIRVSHTAQKKASVLFLSLQCYWAFWLSFLVNTSPYTLPCKPGLPPGVMFRNESKTSKLGLCCIIFTIYWGSKNLCKWVLRVAAYSLFSKRRTFGK